MFELRRLVDNKDRKRRTTRDRQMSKAIISAINKQCIELSLERMTPGITLSRTVGKHRGGYTALMLSIGLQDILAVNLLLQYKAGH